MGATTRGPTRLGAVSVTACDVLSRVDTSNPPACTCACAVRGRRGRRFKSGHPDPGYFPRWDVAFSMPDSSKVQQRLRAKLPPEPLERMERPGV